MCAESANFAKTAAVSPSSDNISNTMSSRNVKESEKVIRIQINTNILIISPRGSLLAHAYHFWSTSVNVFVRYYPAHRTTHTQTDRQTDSSDRMTPPWWWSRRWRWFHGKAINLQHATLRYSTLYLLAVICTFRLGVLMACKNLLYLGSSQNTWMQLSLLWRHSLLSNMRASAYDKYDILHNYAYICRKLGVLRTALSFMGYNRVSGIC